MAPNTPKEIAHKAPEGANVLLKHRDGRLFYAEAFTIGSIFWDDTGSNPRALQGMIYNLKVIAERTGGKNSNIWTWTETNEVVVVPVTKAAPATKPRQERMQKATSTLASARSKTPTPAKPVAPVVKEKVVVQPAVTEAPVKVAAPVVQEVKPAPAAKETVKLNMGDFISVRELDRSPRQKCPDKMFVSFRKNGKIILSKALLKQLPWKSMNIMITPDFKYLALCRGEEYNVNPSGAYSHKPLVSKVVFPEGLDTVRVFVAWDDELHALVGSLPS